VLAPASVQENADLAVLAFDLAEKYRHPVLIASDAAIGQMVEPVELPEMKEHDPSKAEWACLPRKIREEKYILRNVYYDMGEKPYVTYLKEKYARMTENEQRYEAVQTEDAEIVLVAYGISSRIAKAAVKQARAEGFKLGLIRPITLWPFPQKAFDELGDQVEGFLTIEMNILAQMSDDVLLACKHKKPVENYCEFDEVPSVKTVLERAKAMLGK
jgi:2-oxoglutarate ferredoxin oxidoreductase subunit alpha